MEEAQGNRNEYGFQLEDAENMHIRDVIKELMDT